MYREKTEGVVACEDWLESIQAGMTRRTRTHQRTEELTLLLKQADTCLVEFHAKFSNHRRLVISFRIEGVERTNARLQGVFPSYGDCKAKRLSSKRRWIRHLTFLDPMRGIFNPDELENLGPRADAQRSPEGLLHEFPMVQGIWWEHPVPLPPVA